MPLKETLEQLLLLTDQLAPQELERSSFFADFQKLNASVSSADLQAASTPRFSFEKTEFRTRRTLSEKDLKRLGRVAEKMQEELAGLRVIDESKLYSGYKDLNDFLIARTREPALAR